MRNNGRFIESLLGPHWAITEDGLQSMLDIYMLALSRSEALTSEAIQAVIEENESLGHSLHVTSLEALQTVSGTRLEGTRHGKIYDNGIAVIDLIGPIFPRAGLMTMSSGVSVAQFVQDIVRAEAHPNVTGIIINIDSPGGDVRGIGDGAKVINAVAKKSKKQIKVFASGYMASAAYYLGSAVGPGNIVASESGLIGSIGVVLTAMKRDKNEIKILSSISPNKQADAGTDEGRKILQEQVDDLGQIFARDVVKYRSITMDKLLSDFGKGAVFVAPRALKQGLIDKIGTLSQVVDEMAKGTSQSGRTHYQATEADNTVSALLEFSNEEIEEMGLRDMLAKFRQSSEPVRLEEAPTEDAQESTTLAVTTDGEETHTASGTVTEDLIQGQSLPSREELEARFADSAELFATNMVTSNKLFPANTMHTASEMLTAMIDDFRFGGQVSFANERGEIVEGTREQAVRARYEAMPGHTVTQKAIKGIQDGSVEAVVLKETGNVSDENAPMTKERHDELLKMSDQGLAAINNRK